MALTQGRSLLYKVHKHTAARLALGKWIDLLAGPPRAGRLLLTCPLQEFKMANGSRLKHCPAVPPAAMLAQPTLEC